MLPQAKTAFVCHFLSLSENDRQFIIAAIGE